VLKKICFIGICLIMASCRSVEVSDEGGAESYHTDIAEIDLTTSQSFRVGMLLPLTGEDAKYGQGLKNASMLALNDINNPNLILQYYDTKSTPAGARVAIENAVNQRSNLIIGPLKSAEVQAISNETIYRGIPVIAFSTAQEVLQPTVYTLGLLVDEQVDRIMSYAAQQGRQRFALLLPDNATGGAVARAAVKAADKNNVQLTTIGFYKPGTSDFSDIAKQMTNYSRRHARVAQIKSRFQTMASGGDAQAAKALKKLNSREGLGDIGFDALIVPESGVALTAAVSMFAYYDATYPQVQFLGTSVWGSGRLNNEASLAQSLYPGIATGTINAFSNQYYTVFTERPSSLYTLAYDAVRIADVLSNRSEGNLNESITALNGFDGVNGKVRFFKDGTNQHTLDIVKITPTGNTVVDSGSLYFETPKEALPGLDADNTYKVPQIYGKDKGLAQVLIYGRVLDGATTITSDSAEDNRAVTEQLKSMGIYIN
jgi:hypothetical protein